MTQLQEAVNIIGPLIVAFGLALVVMGLVLRGFLSFLDPVSIFGPEVGFLFIGMGILFIIGGIVVIGLKAIGSVPSIGSSNHRGGR